MKLSLVWVSALIACLGAAHVQADTPLAPPADFTHETETYRIQGNVARGETQITRLLEPGAPVWTIPIWAEFYRMAPDARSILVLPGSANLLYTQDPDQIVATVWVLENGAIEATQFPLSTFMDPADMTRTASHFSWMTTIELGEQGWRLTLSDGNTRTITYR